ncbi:MAG: serine/threonine-protein kinase [Fibrobacterota bacterium]
MTGKKIGHYTIERELFAGGMGTVYLARHDELKRTVALKVLRPELSVNPSFVERFEREARIIAKLEHLNILQVYDFGRVDTTCYLVMEWVDGVNLEGLLQKNGPLPWEIACVIFHHVGMALAAAHKQGIVHRDVKPANILIKPNGTVKLADFGIAQDAEGRNITRADEMIGTPSAITPEQIEGKPVTPRSDLFAVGVSLYHAVTGHPPFEGPSIAALFDRILKGEPAAFSDVDAATVPEFEEIVFTCLARDPANRYADAEALDAALRRCLHKYRAINDPSEIEKYLADPSGYVLSQRGTRTAEKLSAAETLRSDGKIFEALAVLREVLSMDPENAEVEARITEISRAVPAREGTTVMERPVLPGKLRFHLTWISMTALLMLLSYAGYRMFGRTEEGTHPRSPSLAPRLTSAPLSASRSGTERGGFMTADTALPLLAPSGAGKRGREREGEFPAKKTRSLPVPAPAAPLPVPAAEASPLTVNDTCRGALTVFSGAWADIYINGKKAGRAPTREPLALPCGTHDLKLENNIGKQYFTKIHVEPDKPLHLTVEKNAFQ